MNLASPPSAVAPVASTEGEIAYLETPKSLLARFGDGTLVQVERSRARAYPGLAASAPMTAPFYEAAARELGGATRVVDFGCGAGLGTRILSESIPHVIGVDASERALEFARLLAPRVQFEPLAALEGPAPAAFDGAALVDVLGHVESPFAVLHSLRARLSAGAAIVIAEPAAYPAQSLANPARRAFSVRGLAALLAASSFAVRDWICDDGTFLACVAVAVDDTGAEALAEGAAALCAGDVERALRAYHVASVSACTDVQVEAQLALADVHVLRRDGDAACRAYFRARDLDPADARPLAGLAQISLAIGHADDARVLAAKGVDLDPAEPTAAGVLAMTLDACGPEDSVPAWRVASNLGPDSLTFATRLAAAALRRNEPALALHVLERVRAYGDDCGAALHLALASTLKAAGRILDARLEARMALARAPLEPEVQRLWKELQP